MFIWWWWGWGGINKSSFYYLFIFVHLVDVLQIMHRSAYELALDGRLNIEAIISTKCVSALGNCICPPVKRSLMHRGTSCRPCDDINISPKDRIFLLQSLVRHPSFIDLALASVMAVLKQHSDVDRNGMHLHVGMVVRGITDGSLKEALQYALEILVTQAFASFLRYLDPNFNLNILTDVLTNLEPSIRSKSWFALSKVPAVIDLEAIARSSHLGYSDIALAPAPITNSGRVSTLIGRFPFSFRIIHLLQTEGTKILAATGASASLMDREDRLHPAARLEQACCAMFGSTSVDLWQLMGRGGELPEYVHDFVLSVVYASESLAESSVFVNLISHILRVTHSGALSSPATIHTAYWRNETRIYHVCSLIGNSYVPEMLREEVACKVAAIKVPQVVDGPDVNAVCKVSVRLSSVDSSILEIVFDFLWKRLLVDIVDQAAALDWALSFTALEDDIKAIIILLRQEESFAESLPECRASVKFMKRLAGIQIARIFVQERIGTAVPSGVVVSVITMAHCTAKIRESVQIPSDSIVFDKQKHWENVGLNLLNSLNTSGAHSVESLVDISRRGPPSLDVIDEIMSLLRNPLSDARTLDFVSSLFRLILSNVCSSVFQIFSRRVFQEVILTTSWANDLDYVWSIEDVLLNSLMSLVGGVRTEGTSGVLSESVYVEIIPINMVPLELSRLVFHLLIKFPAVKSRVLRWALATPDNMAHYLEYIEDTDKAVNSVKNFDELCDFDISSPELLLGAAELLAQFRGCDGQLEDLLREPDGEDQVLALLSAVARSKNAIRSYINRLVVKGSLSDRGEVVVFGAQALGLQRLLLDISAPQYYEPQHFVSQAQVYALQSILARGGPGAMLQLFRMPLTVTPWLLGDRSFIGGVIRADFFRIAFSLDDNTLDPVYEECIALLQYSLTSGVRTKLDDLFSRGAGASMGRHLLAAVYTQLFCPLRNNLMIRSSVVAELLDYVKLRMSSLNSGALSIVLLFGRYLPDSVPELSVKSDVIHHIMTEVCFRGENDFFHCLLLQTHLAAQWILPTFSEDELTMIVKASGYVGWYTVCSASLPPTP